MNAKIADLKNNLSWYLSRVRETGETVVVCDRDKPVATLSPIAGYEDAEWTRRRAESLARAAKIGLKIDLPIARPRKRCMPDITPSIAPDGRTDISTIDFVRGGRDY